MNITLLRKSVKGKGNECGSRSEFYCRYMNDYYCRYIYTNTHSMCLHKQNLSNTCSYRKKRQIVRVNFIFERTGGCFCASLQLNLCACVYGKHFDWNYSVIQDILLTATTALQLVAVDLLGGGGNTQLLCSMEYTLVFVIIVIFVNYSFFLFFSLFTRNQSTFMCV